MRDNPLFFWRTDKDIFFNAGHTFVSYSSRRGLRAGVDGGRGRANAAWARAHVGRQFEGVNAFERAFPAMVRLADIK
jgi:hypothetical protein